MTRQPQPISASASPYPATPRVWISRSAPYAPGRPSQFRGAAPVLLFRLGSVPLKLASATAAARPSAISSSPPVSTARRRMKSANPAGRNVRLEARDAI